MNPAHQAATCAGAPGPDASEPGETGAGATAEGPTVVSGCHHRYTRQAGSVESLGRETAFCLRVVLAREWLHRAKLTAVVGDGTGQALGRLRREELVAVAGGRVALSPAAVPTAVPETERERIL